MGSEWEDPKFQVNYNLPYPRWGLLISIGLHSQISQNLHAELCHQMNLNTPTKMPTKK